MGYIAAAVLGSPSGENYMGYIDLTVSGPPCGEELKGLHFLCHLRVPTWGGWLHDPCLLGSPNGNDSNVKNVTHVQKKSSSRVIFFVVNACNVFFGKSCRYKKELNFFLR